MSHTTPLTIYRRDRLLYLKIRAKQELIGILNILGEIVVRCHFRLIIWLQMDITQSKSSPMELLS
jgi:hypothetical protein